MPHRLFIVSLEGLATAALGPYGASWCPTPAMNRLAAEAAIFDRCIVGSDRPAEVLEAIWDERVSAAHERSEQARPWLAAALQRSLPTMLVTDQAAAVELPSSGHFASQILVSPQPQTQPCDEVSETGLGQLLAAAMERLEALDDRGGLLWVHSDFLTRLWDAPRWLVPESEWDEDDWSEPSDAVELLPEQVGPLVAAPGAPRFFSSTAPPRLLFGSNHDPDITLAWMNTYAAQIRLVDALLEVLLASLAQGPPTTLALLGTSGFALGEHGAIGAGMGPLRSPRIQVPLILRGPGIPAIRSSTPCSPQQLAPTLLECITAAESGGIEPGSIEPGSIEPGSIESGSIESGSIESGSIEPGGIEPGSIEPGGIEPGGIEPGGIESGGIESGGIESGSIESGGIESGGIESGGAGSEASARQPSAGSLLRLLTPQHWAAEPEELEPRIVTRSADGGAVAHTTPAWMYVTDADGSQHLYLKPGDRTDENDVAKRLPEVVERFQTLAR